MFDVAGLAVAYDKKRILSGKLAENCFYALIGSGRVLFQSQIFFYVTFLQKLCLPFIREAVKQNCADFSQRFSK